MNEALIAALNDWRTLNREIPKLREDQLKEMLEWEQTHQRRATVMQRIHQKYTKLRAARERVELLKGSLGI